MIIFFDATVVCEANSSVLARTGVWNIVCGIWKAINILSINNSKSSIEVIPFSLHEEYDIIEIEDISSDFTDILPSGYEFHRASRIDQIARISEVIHEDLKGIVLIAPYGPIKDALKIIPSDHITVIHYIHDLIPIYSPELCSNYSVEIIQSKLSDISSDDIVLCNSQYTRDRITDWWSSCRNDPAPPRIEVIEPGIQIPQSTVAMKHNPQCDVLEALAGRPYFLSLSTIEPRKNVIRMLHAFRLFKKLYRGVDDVLFLLAGAEGWISDEERMCIRELCASSNNQIILLGYIEDKIAEVLLENTLGVVQVSLDEGYGLTVRAARAMGKPCICSSIPSLTDSYTDLDLYVDPYSIESIACGLHDAYLMQGRNLIRFNRTWEDVACDLGAILSNL
jgi:glycosyltransferase involved in cell wall biosynthesis